uniref:Reverse transcriptase zinc-binding domain-containing protein n=1 Tax=Medicago truncatula TaxID=3880 RepID=A2Q184_MEDTR|nr:hypothetical protein MtrDRAFT_AC148340g38v2 [Medicago truncatula]
MHYDVARGVWLELFRWVGNTFIIPQNLFNHWLCWNVGSSNKKIIRDRRLIWHASIWLIWKARNDKFVETNLSTGQHLCTIHLT